MNEVLRKKRRPNRTSKEIFDDAMKKSIEQLEKEVRLTESSLYLLKYFASLVVHNLNGNSLEELGCSKSYWNEQSMKMTCAPKKPTNT